MQLELTEVQREELARLVSSALADLSAELADTDNPEYRAALRDRRAHLAAVLAQLVGNPQQPD